MIADSTINLMLEPSVSTIDWSNSVMVEGSVIPAVRTRSTETSVVLEDGGTMVISGLLQAGLARKIQEVPLFGRLPLIGSLFKSHKDVDEETDLLIMVTAQKAREADTPDALAEGKGEIETEEEGGENLGR
jgi:pilus assembly protein CpaC